MADISTPSTPEATQEVSVSHTCNSCTEGEFCAYAPDPEIRGVANLFGAMGILGVLLYIVGEVFAGLSRQIVEKWELVGQVAGYSGYLFGVLLLMTVLAACFARIFSVGDEGKVFTKKWVSSLGKGVLFMVGLFVLAGAVLTGLYLVGGISMVSIVATMFAPVMALVGFSGNILYSILNTRFVGGLVCRIAMFYDETRNRH